MSSSHRPFFPNPEKEDYQWYDLDLDDEFRGIPCPACSKIGAIRDPALPTPEPFDYYIETSAEARTIMNGWAAVCGLCELIRDLDRSWAGNSYNGPPSSHRNWKEDGYRGGCGRVRNSSSQVTTRLFNINVDQYGNHDIFRLLPKRPRFGAVLADPLSAPVVAKWQHWLEDCKAQHEECKNETNFMPTRVLDIHDLRSIKLIESDGLRCPYVTLSHCWGVSKSFQTTASTIASRKSGFTLDEIPATFRDAILVTQTLNIRYLWIDSLCIIQNDGADLVRELASMGDIYSQAYLTIAAANCSDDNDGFLRNRPYSNSLLRIHSSSGEMTEIYLQSYETRDLFIHSLTLKEPLNNRGWALQEQLLSRRLLCFGTAEITWFCEKWRLIESDALTNKHDSQVYNGPRELNWNLKDLLPVKTENTLISYYPWYRMIESQFSVRTISYDADKLPAVAGLASHIAKQHNTKYCAGVWWEDTWLGLAWARAITHHASISRPSIWRAPSWSWASVNGPVTYGHRLYERKMVNSVTFLECVVAPKSGNPYTEVISGYIRLQTPILSLCRTEVPSWERLGNFEIAGTTTWCNGNLDYADEDRNGLSFLPIWFVSPREEWLYVYGLIVRQSSHSSDRYERVGFLEVDCDPTSFLGERVSNVPLIVKNAPLCNILLY